MLYMQTMVVKTVMAYHGAGSSYYDNVASSFKYILLKSIKLGMVGYSFMNQSKGM